MSDWLLDTLLATSVLAALVLLVREPVRSRFGSRVTYGLWLIPAARLVMPTLTTTVERTVPAGGGYRSLAPQVAGERLLLTNLSAPEPSLLDRLGGWPTILLGAWLAVALGLFLSRMIAFRRDRRAILDSSVAIARIGSVRVVSSPEVSSPVAFGILDRVIAVPTDFDRLYGARERRLALEHELAHHQSGDLVANLLAFVLLCLQWFNPLAWAAHAAFRFDQEAACDARVLDNAKADDRADYGRAIAKAASGRALLFASALDRRHTLHRRLQSMLRSSNPAQRLAGRLLIAVAMAVALPLTASRAVDYVDVPAPAAPVVRSAPAAKPVALAAPVAAVAALAAPAPVARPVAPAPPAPPLRTGDEQMTINDSFVVIDGTRKRWEELTPAERTRVRAAVAKAREGLAKAHFDRERVMRDVDGAMRRIDRGELQRNLAAAQASAAEAMRRLDSQSGELRRWAQDSEQLKESIRRSMESVRAIDAEKIQRALEAADPQRISAALDHADQAMRRAQAELDRIDARVREDRP